MDIDIEFLIKILDENKGGLRIYDYLTERFHGRYTYDSYILTTRNLILLDKNTEVFKTELSRISEVCWSRIDVNFEGCF